VSRRRNLTPHERRRIVEQYKAGDKVLCIALANAISTSLVAKLAREAGLQRRKGGTHPRASNGLGEASE
jgi:hypothetical protein